MSNLDVLTIVPNEQKFICLSFLVNKEDGNTMTGIRFGGAYSTYEEACKQAKNIQANDKYHNVFVGESGKWLPFDPDPNSKAINNSEYADEQLNKLMNGHKNNQEQANIFHELRKTEKMADNINDNLSENNKNKEDLLQQLSNAKTVEDVTLLTNSIDDIDNKIQRMESRLKECKENEEQLKKKITTNADE